MRLLCSDGLHSRRLLTKRVLWSGLDSIPISSAVPNRSIEPWSIGRGDFSVLRKCSRVSANSVYLVI